MSRLTNEQKREQLSIELIDAEKKVTFLRSILQKLETATVIEPDYQVVPTSTAIIDQGQGSIIPTWWKNVIAKVQRIHL